MVKQYHFLVNPVSGGGEGKKVHEFLPEIMESMGFAPDSWVSELTGVDGLQQQVAKALENCEKLVAVGGDGTVNAVLEEVARRRATHIHVGLIPLGTGNDLARVMRLYEPYANRGLLYLVRKLVQASPRPFDLWTINGERVLANYFSSGIDARIAHDFNRDRSQGRIPGKSVLANKLHYVRSFFKDRAHCLGESRLEWRDIDGVWHSMDLQGFRTVLVGNIPSFAGGSDVFQGADMSDGILELVPVSSLFRFIGGILLGTSRLSASWFHKWWLPSLQATEIRFFLAPGEFCQVDGEDVSGRWPKCVHIRYACQSQLLTLP